MNYAIIQHYSWYAYGKPAFPPTEVGRFKSGFRAWLYKKLHRDWFADGAWKDSFSWEIVPLRGVGFPAGIKDK